MSTVKAGAVEPLTVFVKAAADEQPLTGSTNLRVEVRRANTPNVNYHLDFADGTLKAAGWTTKRATLTEVNATDAPGWYEYVTAGDVHGLDTTTLPNGVYVLTFREITTTLALGAPVVGVGELRVGGSIENLDTRLPDALDGGNMPSKVITIADGAITAASIATDAITNAKIAAGAIGASEAPLLANLDTNVGSRAAPGAAMDLVDNAVDAGAIAVSGVTKLQNGLATSAALVDLQADTDDIQARLPSSLTAQGRMRVHVEALDANVITAAAVATDAIDADAIAGSAVTEITAGLPTAVQIADALLDRTVGTRPAGSAGEALGRVDVLVSSRLAALSYTAPPTAGAVATAVDTTLSAAHGGGSWATATGFAQAGDPMTLTSGERTAIATAVNTTLGGAHGSGSWTTATGFAVPGSPMALTSDERDAVAAAAGSSSATAVWAAPVVDAGQGTRGRELHRLYQLGFNRQELSAFGGGLFTLYDNDHTTTLLTVAIRDVDGSAIAVPLTSPARRAEAVFA